MATEIIDGRNVARQIKVKLTEETAALKSKPCLAVVLAGNDEASLVYVRNKEKAAQEVGMTCVVHRLAEDVRQEEVDELIDNLNKDFQVNGIIVQQPLPKQLQPEEVLKRIAPEKDVDGFGVYNSGLLWTKAGRAFAAATPKGIVKLVKSVWPDLSGKHAVIIGRSNIVGKPLAALLLNEDCTVTVVHSKSQNIAEICREADVLIAACGQAHLVKKEWVKPGAVVIDVGINRVNGKLTGDVDFDDVWGTAGYITPVPGGVGPMTVAMLLENTLEAFLLQNGEV